MRSAQAAVGPKTGELAGVTRLGVIVVSMLETVRGRLVGGMDDTASEAKTRLRDEAILGKDGGGTPLDDPMEEVLLSFLMVLGVGDMGVATIKGRSMTVYRSKASKRVGIRA